MALRMALNWPSVSTPAPTYSSRAMSFEARLRIVKLGEWTMGGRRPSNLCPPIGRSPETIGFS